MKTYDITTEVARITGRAEGEMTRKLVTLESSGGDVKANNLRVPDSVTMALGLGGVGSFADSIQEEGFLGEAVKVLDRLPNQDCRNLMKETEIIARRLGIPRTLFTAVLIGHQFGKLRRLEANLPATRSHTGERVVVGITAPTP